MNSVQVSVVIPVYNAERYLGECLDSVLGQTLRDIEVICIDDGSTDGSDGILSRYAEGDSRIRIVRQANAGPGPARNRGVELAAGEFVAFMDPDDLYPDAGVLEALYAYAEGAGVAAVGGSMEELLPNGSLCTCFRGDRSGFCFRRTGVIAYADYQFDHGFWRFLYRRRLLLENRIRFPDLRRYQDPPFFVRALHAAGRFGVLRRPVYRYRISYRPVDWKAASGRKLSDYRKGLLDVAAFAAEHGYWRLFALTRTRVERELAPLLGRPAGPKPRSLSKVVGDMAFAARVLLKDGPRCLAWKLRSSSNGAS